MWLIKFDFRAMVLHSLGLVLELGFVAKTGSPCLFTKYLSEKLWDMQEHNSLCRISAEWILWKWWHGYFNFPKSQKLSKSRFISGNGSKLHNFTDLKPLNFRLFFTPSKSHSIGIFAWSGILNRNRFIIMPKEWRTQEIEPTTNRYNYAN